MLYSIISLFEAETSTACLEDGTIVSNVSNNIGQNFVESESVYDAAYSFFIAVLNDERLRFKIKRALITNVYDPTEYMSFNDLNYDYVRGYVAGYYGESNELDLHTDEIQHKEYSIALCYIKSQQFGNVTCDRSSERVVLDETEVVQIFANDFDDYDEIVEYVRENYTKLIPNYIESVVNLSILVSRIADYSTQQFYYHILS